MKLGTVLIERYKIEAELGRGGMGIVYRGHDTRLNRPVAIKILSSPELSDEDHVHLLAEARAAAQLNHPNVVTVYDALEAENQPFIVMELVEGRTLRSIPQPTIKDSIDYARQICSALAHAHSKGIIHRDLKPENALLTPSGVVKLMDFGLARYIEGTRQTKTGTLMGTFAFMAPELFKGEPSSPQSDLYALGLMLYEFLTGTSPFDRENLGVLISQHLNKAVTLPRELLTSLPEGLNELILQMLDKNPKNRPVSAHTVETILASYQTDRMLTLPIPLDQLGVESQDGLINTPPPGRLQWEKEWKRKSYPRSAVPALETGEKEQILANRARELAEAVQYLNDHRILLITGMPGIGKSTLARTLLEFIPSESPPPFWYNFERQQSSGNTLGVLLDRISGYLEKFLGSEVREEILSFRNSPEQQASSYDVDVLIDALNQPTPLWLIFDNFEVILSQGGDRFLDDGLEMLFSSLKHNSHNARIIISGLFVPRLNNGEYLLEFGTRPISLQGLSEKFAVEVLRAHGLENIDHEILATIAGKLNGHPFALNHAAHYVEALGVQDALKNLQGGMDEFSKYFKTTLQQRLDPGEFSVLQDLTVLQRDISLEGLCWTAQTRPATIKRLREEGLLEASDTGKFWLPSIVRENLKEENTEASKKAHRRAAQFYREQKQPPAPHHIDDFADVLEWHYHAIHAGEIADAYQAVFASGLIDQLKEWNEFTLSLELCERIYSSIQPQANPLDRSKWVQLNRKLGVIYFLLGKYKQSIEHLEYALAALIESDSPVLRAALMIDLAESVGNQGDPKRAMDLCNQGIAQLESGLEYAKALLVRGILHRQSGELTKAIADLEQARTLYEMHKQVTGVAYVTGELGIVYYYLNEFPRAVENYRRATLACEAMKDTRGAMIGHLNIGDVLLQQRQYKSACLELHTALELARKKKITRDELNIGLYLAEAEIGLGQLEEAREELGKVQSLLVTVPSPCAQGNAVRLQARLQWLAKDSTAAIENFERALTLLASPDCEYEMAHTQLDLAPILHELGRLEEAESALQKAQQIFTAINNQLGLEAIEETRKQLNAS
jgi:tetratricopeptide (TPR) repeat protein